LAKIKTHNLRVKIDAALQSQSWTNLFPVGITQKMEDELLVHFSIPSILISKFRINSISKFGDLRGMSVEQFLSWDGFGYKCFLELCPLLISIRYGTLLKLSFTTSHGFPLNLSGEIKDFPIDKLDLHFVKSIETRFGIRTISEFIQALDIGTISVANCPIKHLEIIHREVTKLSAQGTQTYFKEFSNDSLTFVEIISFLENKLNRRELLLFKTRLFPNLSKDFKTLEQVGRNLNVTRERARQIETILIKRLRRHKLLFLIRIKTLSSLDWGTKIIKFEILLDNPFFKEVTVNSKGIPSAALLLSKVFPHYFKLTNKAIMLCRD
jgi:hypothetical protein